ncbi:uncharacterized protein DDB_G0287625-like [Uloborus diversus]|uniref:uncharacterized protein DDB_G0287625-like n=1 Tax=Uloborus diversus TaxID=327109 RepID=UPI0024091FB9|nr:uncharacterized protein DDB_G0287625-like [Uloborus diversus]
MSSSNAIQESQGSFTIDEIHSLTSPRRQLEPTSSKRKSRTTLKSPNVNRKKSESKSPSRSKSKSPSRSRSKSPSRSRSNSPSRSKSKSPSRSRSKSSSRSRSKSSSRSSSVSSVGSSVRAQSKSPVRKSRKRIRRFLSRSSSASSIPRSPSGKYVFIRKGRGPKGKTSLIDNGKVLKHVYGLNTLRLKMAGNEKFKETRPPVKVCRYLLSHCARKHLRPRDLIPRDTLITIKKKFVGNDR